MEHYTVKCISLEAVEHGENKIFCWLNYGV